MRDFMSEFNLTKFNNERARTKRVAEAFNRDALKRICEMHESEFAAAYDMEVTPVMQRAPADFYAFKDNGSNILAVAHLDTVGMHDERTAHIFDTEGGPVIFSRALDDRLGAYVILDLLPTLLGGQQFDILLTVGEEDGMSTASYFKPPEGKEYQWMIEFDRGGTDVVMYQYEDSETFDLVKAAGAKVGSGSFSDISYLEHMEVKGFNWGVGYQDYHGPRAHAFLEDTFSMVAKFLVFHEDNVDNYLPHDQTTSYWGSYKSWGSYSGWGSILGDDEEETVVTVEVVGERECDVEFGEHDHDDECARILDAMKIGVGSSMDWEQEQYNREAEEDMLGRPLLPNER